MMKLTTLRVAGVFGLLALGSLTSAWAQTPPGAEPSTGCRLFPLACPGPVPAPPPPLVGAPEDQAAATAPVPVEPHAKHHRKAHKQPAAVPPQ